MAHLDPAAARTRRSARSDLRSYDPQSPLESRCQEFMLFALDRLTNPFDRSTGLHFTASAIATTSASVLLHLHKTHRFWLQPGGHIEPDELPWRAALRELLEETGVSPPGNRKPPLIHIDLHDAGSGHTHMDLRYLLVLEPTLPLPSPNESLEIDWIPHSTIEELPNIRPNLRRALAAALEATNFRS